MARSKATIQQELETTRREAGRYLEREADMLAKNGVQSYGIGSPQYSILQYSPERHSGHDREAPRRIRELEAELEGRAPRRALGVVRATGNG